RCAYQGALASSSSVAGQPAIVRDANGRWRTSANRFCARMKGANHERPHKHIDEVRASQRGSRLPAAARIDGDHLLVLRLSEMVGVRGAGADSVYQQRPAHFLDVSHVRHPPRELVPGSFGMADRRALAPGILEQEIGNSRSIGSCATFVSTVTIIPFMPNGWDPVAGFPAMAGNVPFLMKDLVLLAVSFY